ncbi:MULTISPECIES: alpha/beta fold hydrolase [unclassified Streptomyces]|uniref:alpha/beta fold hydrolase n=1 Tax=unclassified Streptomyces TaxID=2593676 RepID=UPI001F035D31|nr:MULTISPECIES: alpha/beta hydrolase [unclassified Streptomyces]MCH0565931.1 alpha/beta hydrolase [Streptomyces sp. MUM 2J]MCH0569096.1 alpha/beta hydrolase [Streptomyces sp. MUM 136J]
MGGATKAGSGAAGDVRSGSVTTDDGVRLHCLEAGSGPAMLLVPGWSQTAAQWRHQIAEFSRTRHVIALDHRGHGDSARPEHGYRIARLAADLRQLVLALGLDDITLVCHSMGCAVAWSYWDLFDGDRLGRLVLFDEPPALIRQPFWPEGLADRLGALYDLDEIAGVVAGLRDPDADATAMTVEFLSGMWSPSAPAADREWVAGRNLLLPREYAGRLLLDNVVQDWRDVLPRITVPTLVMGGKESVIPLAAARTVADAVPGAVLRILDERGSHFAFWENPGQFNHAIREFLQAADA